MARPPASSETDRGGGTEAQAKDVCVRLLTMRAHSRSELTERLAKRGFEPDVARAALDRLTEVGLIDDAAFARQWVHSRHQHSGKGRAALGIELRGKGIAADLADAALAEISRDDERERATELVHKKLRAVDVAELDAGERDRLTRRLVGMLARRGYSQSMAFDMVRSELRERAANAES
jgi:regulatory protein